jgi:hypothetical protein
VGAIYFVGTIADKVPLADKLPAFWISSASY